MLDLPDVTLGELLGATIVGAIICGAWTVGVLVMLDGILWALQP